MTPLLTAEPWDIVVIGAGPAGSVAAHQTARLGARTLLLERAAFPRHKVCGGCLSADGVAALRAAGLGQVVHDVTESTLTSIHLAGPNARADIPMQAGIVIRRDRLDQALAIAAVDAGATFIDQARVTRMHRPDSTHRLLEVTRNGTRFTIRARCVIAAAGLTGANLFAHEPITSHTRPRSKFGVGCITHAPGGRAPGVIEMAMGDPGYVGTVPVADGLIVAAALDLDKVRATDLTSCVQSIRRNAGLMPLPDLGHALRGTPRLTHHRTPLALPRLFLIGDCARYVEPFTGEGMTWAIKSAIGVSPIAVEATSTWHDRLARRWHTWHHRAMRPHMHACALIARLLAFPSLTIRAAERLDAIPNFSARP